MSRVCALLVLAAVLVPGSLALASSDPARQPSPAPAAAAPLLLSFLATPECALADLPARLPAQQPTANDICGGCSDAVCAGKQINAVCGEGFRCILQPSCTPVAPSCHCLIIG